MVLQQPNKLLSRQSIFAEQTNLRGSSRHPRSTQNKLALPSQYQSYVGATEMSGAYLVGSEKKTIFLAVSRMAAGKDPPRHSGLRARRARLRGLIAPNEAWKIEIKCCVSISRHKFAFLARHRMLA